jgi:hypothetical protein
MGHDIRGTIILGDSKQYTPFYSNKMKCDQFFMYSLSRRVNLSLAFNSSSCYEFAAWGDGRGAVAAHNIGLTRVILYCFETEQEDSCL